VHGRKGGRTADKHESKYNNNKERGNYKKRGWWGGLMILGKKWVGKND